MSIQVQPQPVPVAPGRIPLLGHVGHLLVSRLEFLDGLRQHGPVVQIALGTQPAWVVTDPHLTHQMLVEDVNSYQKGGRIIEALRMFFGNGLATIASGEDHRRNRRLMQPMFTRAHLATRRQPMIDYVRDSTAAWQAGVPRPIHKEMGDLTLGTFLTTMFGDSVPQATQEELPTLLPEIMAGTLLQTILPPRLTTLPLPFNRRHHARLQRLRDLVDAAIDQHRQQRDQRANDHQPGLFNILFDARDVDTGKGMDPIQLREEVITLLTAAIETTSTTLAWSLYEIGRRPEVERRLHQELDAVCGDRPLHHTDLDALRYTRCIIQEAMRCYGPAWMVSRITTTDVQLGDYTIREGNEVIYSPYVLQHDPGVFPDPHRFNPDRWLSETTHSQARRSFLAFGDGKRKCIGETFAWDELVITLAVISSRWQLRRTSRRHVRPVADVTVHPSKLLMAPYPRFSVGV